MILINDNYKTVEFETLDAVPVCYHGDHAKIDGRRERIDLRFRGEDHEIWQAMKVEDGEDIEAGSLCLTKAEAHADAAKRGWADYRVESVGENL